MEIDLTVYGATVILVRLLIFFVLPLAYLVLKTRKDPRIYEKLEEFPGPKAIPLFGNSLRLVGIGGSVGIFNQICYEDIRDFGVLYRLWMLNQPKVVISSAPLAEKILQGMQHHPKSDNYRFLHAWMGLGLLTSQGNHWRAHRKILTPAFHFSILHEFLQIFNKNSKVLSKKLESVAEKGETINIFDFVSLCALDIIHESSMGTTINAQLQEGSPYVLAVKVLNESLLERYFSPTLRLDWIYNISSLKRKTMKALKVVDEFTDKVIEERTKYSQNSNLTTDSKSEKDADDEFGTKKQLAFIDLLLRAEMEDGHLMSRKDIRDEVSTFMFEGHDTVTTATCWTLFLVGTYPEIQERAMEELRQVFGDSDRAATMNDLAELKYLERCIKETLRLYPSVPFFERLTTEDIVLECGKTIPAGCTIGVNAFVIHRDPEHFPNPEQFDPDRFLPENSSGRNPYAYIPFSAGPRNCIGQKFAILEEKVLVSTILRNFKVEAAHSPEEAILEVRVFKYMAYLRLEHTNICFGGDGAQA